MERLRGIALVVVVLGVLCLAPLGALASTNPTGTAVEISGINDFGATAWGWIKGWPGRLAGGATAIGGLIKMGSRQREGGGVQLLSGVGVAFVPSVISTAFESAPALGVTQGLAAVPTVLDGLRGGRLHADPLFYVILGVTLVMLAALRRREQTTLAL
jgi:hypothetical protein